MKAVDLLNEAAELIDGPRAEQHGDMQDNHENIAELWNAFLRIRRDPVAPLTGSQVAICMALVKVARTQTGDDNPDDLRDAAGYCGIASELTDAE
jgi:hypothetical protein